MTQLEVGIGLPSTVPGVSRTQILDWAVRAEEFGASSIACVDRLSYPSWDPMIALAAAAGLGGWGGAIAFAERVREAWGEGGGREVPGWL